MSIYHALALSAMCIMLAVIIGLAIVAWVKACADRIDNFSAGLIASIIPVTIILWVLVALRLAGKI